MDYNLFLVTHSFLEGTLFMNNITYFYYENSHFEKYSVSDIKSLFMGGKYAYEVLKLSDKLPINISNWDIINKISDFAMIHRDSA